MKHNRKVSRSESLSHKSGDLECMTSFSANMKKPSSQKFDDKTNKTLVAFFIFQELSNDIPKHSDHFPNFFNLAEMMSFTTNMTSQT